MKTHTHILLCGLAIGWLAACNTFNPVVPNPDTNNPKDSVATNPSDNPDIPDSSATTNPSLRNLSYLFDINALPEITITLTEHDWNTYLSNFDKWEKNGLYVPASFSFRKGNDEFRRDSVGLRPRGNTSRVRPEGSNGEKHRNGAKWHHAHFGVKFTEYTTGERFFGCDRLILKWFHEDPAYCREVYSYDLFHRFGVWSAPYASYCRLSIYIQGDTRPVYMGVYAMIENPRKGWLNDRMKEGHIPDKTGNMWKASWGADLSNADKSRMGISDDYGNVNPVYDLKTNKAQLADAQEHGILKNISERRKYFGGRDDRGLHPKRCVYVSSGLFAFGTERKLALFARTVDCRICYLSHTCYYPALELWCNDAAGHR